MKLRGPILTLIAGAAFAAVLLGIDMTSQHPAAVGAGAPRPPANGASTPAPTTAPSPTASTTPAPPNATYAGNVDGGSGASIAIAVHNGTAVAYLCDGRTEAWLQGSATGAVALTGAGHSTLFATYAQGRLTGSITANSHSWTFSVGPVAPPSGLYRATATVRSARIVGGWIVLPDGRQVGVVDVDGRPGPAATLDTTSLTSTVNDTTVTAAPVDGSPIPLAN
jgi:serine/threonine-protein kinase